jgi:hypothetical protein
VTGELLLFIPTALMWGGSVASPNFRAVTALVAVALVLAIVTL